MIQTPKPITYNTEKSLFKQQDSMKTRLISTSVMWHVISLKCGFAKEYMGVSGCAMTVWLCNRLGPTGLEKTQCETVMAEELDMPVHIPVCPN